MSSDHRDPGVSAGSAPFVASSNRLPAAALAAFPALPTLTLLARELDEVDDGAVSPPCSTSNRGYGSSNLAIAARPVLLLSLDSPSS